ncbi:MAG: pilus assembly protein [Asticcacaulis sp.]|nr:pilus assembly protein [Asticcacaulis sp.]
MQAGSRHLNVLRLYRHFHRNRKGAVAVEFALVAFPLIFLLLACFELAMIIVLSVTLDHATDVTARQIRTGIMTQGNSTAAGFVQKVCDNMGWLAATCPSSLHIDVQTYDSFAQVPTADLIKNGKFDTANFAYNIGGGSKIQLVRAYYEWPLFTPLLQAGLSTLGNKDAVVSSKVVFRNEPF